MGIVTLKIYRCVGEEKRLVQTRHIEQSSAKPLNGKRALAILRREVTDIGLYASVQKTDDGWL